GESLEFLSLCLASRHQSSRHLPPKRDARYSVSILSPCDREKATSSPRGMSPHAVTLTRATPGCRCPSPPSPKHFLQSSRTSECGARSQNRQSWLTRSQALLIPTSDAMAPGILVSYADEPDPFTMAPRILVSYAPQDDEPDPFTFQRFVSTLVNDFTK